ncbi:phosphoenolpyruvate carboxylase [Chryseosolibacter indicus]|uniref:Phosphoenolpyruvate carboxylase n=1 Tax=Chryseosolibacter indicus TaxID=2782351 RepID=A0ABS5VT57_9BACT|nr:phosphoenolpyruvate carboxylase [Chryseosolibacter indicus]MBT1704597.1 phosphoenolpyruvate carboxylase [Chryseosolibacter indicus]
MTTNYNEAVSTRYHIYNSLFLNLPYSGIYRTGTLLPLLQQACEAGFEKGKDPKSIIKKFFSDFTPSASRDEQFDLLFNFIQYTERQVVLFDSIEDAAFEEINDLNGRGTINALLIRAQSEGVIEDLKRKLQDFSVRLVLTAHPTQFYPGNVLAIINDLEEAIREGRLEDINLLLRQLGKTAFINREKPTPYDEAVSLCWFLENVFYHTIPTIVQKLFSGLQINAEEWKNFDLIKIGFWPGGDRDGNPFVTHEITRKVAQHLKRTLMRCYYRDARFLKRRLTFKGVDSIIADVERKIYPLAYGIGDGEVYTNPSELLEDLLKARKLLIEDHRGLFLDLLDEFILKVRIFCFNFASMDIRQDSRKHGYAWEAILKQLQAKDKKLKNFNQLSEEEQINTLLKLKFKPASLKFDDPFVTELIESIEVIKDIQAQNGTEGCHRYVISNCQSAVDVIRVYQLAKLLLAKGDELNLDIVPLFETIEDLASAADVMRSLYSIPKYREHIERRGNKQTIMLGFSDGTKDGGYLRANWSIFRAKENLTLLSREYGITAVFFDGRGGPPARGGGNTHDFYASLGDTIEDKEVQITIQGQTISSNFGKLPSCQFNLEQLLSAGIENSVFKKRKVQLSDTEKQLLESLAEAGYKAYLELKHHNKFVPYLEKMTPLPFFGDTNIGSRPVKRNQGDSLKFEDLRAIPFVGSWAQMKQNIPGFYGVGSALQQIKKEGKLNEVKRLYNQSLFFRTLLANSMMSLTKTYYPATAYIGKDKEFGEFWKIMHDEYKLSVKMILEVSGLSELMQNNPINRDSVKLRERIVLPLITIQQFALQQLRNMEATEKQYEKQYRKLALRCMFGIINAARNSA